MYQMKAHFKGFPKLVIFYSYLFQKQKRKKNAPKRPEPLSESYTGNTWKSGNFRKIISPAIFEPLSAASLLLETAVIAPVCVLIQLEAFLTPLVATVLQLIEKWNQCIPK